MGSTLWLLVLRARRSRLVGLGTLREGVDALQDHLHNSHLIPSGINERNAIYGSYLACVPQRMIPDDIVIVPRILRIEARQEIS